jgi:hypothetical protein
MAGVDAKNIEAGTPPYLDPFLGIGARRQYDTAAERYGAAVVLFEMATGRTPWYGTDENANPATVDDNVTLRSDMFESTIAFDMSEFFGSALSRRAADRPDTAEDMLRAWRTVFSTLGGAPSDRADDSAAEKAQPTTALTASGLSARAVSALATVQVTTVGELMALDSTRLNRLVAREAKDTRKEITGRYRSWTRRLGKEKRQASDDALMGLDDAVELLLSAVSGARSSTRKDAADLLLGAKPGLDAFASSTELAAALGKAPQRGPQLLKELQDDWAERADTRELLDAVSEITRQVLSDFGRNRYADGRDPLACPRPP